AEFACSISSPGAKPRCRHWIHSFGHLIRDNHSWDKCLLKAIDQKGCIDEYVSASLDLIGGRKTQKFVAEASKKCVTFPLFIVHCVQKEDRSMKTKLSGIFNHAFRAVFLVLLVTLSGVARAQDDTTTATSAAEANGIGVGVAGDITVAPVTTAAAVGQGGSASGGDASISNVTLNPQAAGGDAAIHDINSAASSSVSDINPIGKGGESKINFEYKPTSVSVGSKIPKSQHATNATAFVPVPGVMQEFTIDSRSAQEAAMLNLYAGQVCGPKAYTSGKFKTIKTTLSSEDDSGDSVDVNLTFTPRPDFQENTNKGQRPSAAFVTYHEEVNWNDTYTCLGVINVDPDDVNEQLDHDTLQNAIGAYTSSSKFGSYGKVVSVYTRGSMKFRSGSASDVTTIGLSMSGSGTPGVDGFVQGALGFGNTNGSVVHTDATSLKVLVLAVNPHGRRLLSYGQFERTLFDQLLAQENHKRKTLNPVNPQVSTPVAAQAVGATTGR
ncbi:MAG: hypothetical protein PHT88_05555, partial [Candidatus Moranbacteria bacterium]|nr:hypothetical protein [Candidatus Moranbacteria bacterium]